MEPETQDCLTLSLADGAHWLIRAGDAQAGRIVARLGQVMTAATDLSRHHTHELRVVTGAKGRICAGPPHVCIVGEPSDETMLTIGMSRVALALACASLERGGLLIHGALAAYARPGQPGVQQGVLFAGPGTVGKSTASRRLPPPWRSLCDDTTLVLPDPEGRYWAHPWPTWSQFYSYDDQPAVGGCWPVEQAVPLSSLFFLSQDPVDRVEPRTPAQTTAMIMEVVEHVTRIATRTWTPRETQELHRRQLVAAQGLARVIPAHTLHISLTGAFWTEVEAALPPVQEPPPVPAPPSPRTVNDAGQRGVDSWLDDDLLHFAYRGPSMNPTLREPDLVDVRPYGDWAAVRRGDVIYYRSPHEDDKDERMIVHRVIQVLPGGSVRTRGDNNASPDPYILPAENIMGQVIAAARPRAGGGRWQRPIVGGWRGAALSYVLRARRLVLRSVARALQGAYRAVGRSGLVARLWPARLHPRVVIFDGKPYATYKLLLDLREIGRYNYLDSTWTIRRPWRLLVDEGALPHPERPQWRDMVATPRYRDGAAPKAEAN